MRKKSLSVSLVSSAVLLLVTAGCTTTRLGVVYEDTDRPALGSYAWASADGAEESPDSGVTDPGLSEVVRQAADRVLAAKGYTKATDGSPSFWIGYDASFKQGSRTAAPGNAALETISHYIGEDHAGATKSVPHSKGTLVLRCVSRVDPTVYWQGTVTGDVAPGASIAKRHAQMAEAVESILEPFPAR